MPGIGNGVAEGVDGAIGIGAEAVVGDEDHAGGAERQEALAGAHRADADGGRRIVAAATGDRDPPPGEPPVRGEAGGQVGRDFGAFDQ